MSNRLVKEEINFSPKYAALVYGFMRSFKADTGNFYASIPRMVISMVFWFYGTPVIVMPRKISIKHILPCSVIDNPRYMGKKYQDALAIITAFRSKPDIFLTITAFDD